MSRYTLPAVMPGGDLMPFMSGRHRQSIMDALFEHTGGFPRAAAWIEKNDENYAEFFKMWAKGATRPSIVENVSGPVAVEDLLQQLDSQLVNVTPTSEPSDG